MARRLTESEKEEVIDYMRNMRAPEGASYVDAGDRMLMDQSIYRTLPSIEENFERLPIEFQDRVIRGGMERRARAEQQFMGASGGQLVTPNIRSGGLLSPNMPNIDFGIDQYARAQSEAAQRDRGVEPTVPMRSNQVTTMPPPVLQNETNKGIFGDVLAAMSGVAGKIAEKRGFTEPKTSPQSANQMIPTQVGATPINASNTLPNAPTSINNFPQRQNIGAVGPFSSENRDIMEVYDPDMDYTKYLPNTAGSPMPSGGRVDPSLRPPVSSSGPATFAPDQIATAASIAPSVDTSFGDANQLGFKQDGALGMQGIDANQFAKNIDIGKLEYTEAEIKEDLKEIINPAANVDYKRLAKALALGFNTLRLNPDQQLSQFLGKSLEQDRQLKLSKAAADRYRKAGYTDIADALQAGEITGKEAFSTYTELSKAPTFRPATIEEKAEYGLKADDFAQIDTKSGKLYPSEGGMSFDLGDKAGSAIDTEFAKTYMKDLRGLGGSIQQINVLKGVLDALQSGEVETGVTKGLLPDWALLLTENNARSLQARNEIAGIVQQTLRETLGAQFTEKEGENLLRRAWDLRQPTEVNIKNTRRLLEKAMSFSEEKMKQLQYFQTNGTLKGYKSENLGKLMAELDSIRRDLIRGFSKPELEKIKENEFKFGGDTLTIKPKENQ